MSKKLVSVIVPCFNDNDILSQAIKSVESQSHKNIEIIVVDDFSKKEIKHAYVQKLTNHNTKLIRNSKNLGANLSINKGFNVASGDYICVLAADDTLPLESIKERVKVLDKGADLVFGSLKKIYKGEETLIENLQKLDNKSVFDWLSSDKKVEGINNATAMFSKELLKKTGLRLDRGVYGSHEDYEFVLRLLYNALEPVSILENCYIYYLADSGNMNSVKFMNEEKWESDRKRLEVLYVSKFIHREEK